MNKLSWAEVEDTAIQLANKIIGSNFEPDFIIGITTGGLYPLAMLARQLKLKNILTITALKTNKDGKEIVTIKHLPVVDLQGKKVLLVDEIAQSGLTLKKISEIILEKYGVRMLKTATLAVNKDVCELYPDYYVLTEEGNWIIFPWEKEKFPPYNLKK